MREKTPWDQHASAAGLPRFNYKALSSTDSLKGFLVTCALDREKSATKEAIDIISKHFERSNAETSVGVTAVDVHGNTERAHCEERQLSLGDGCRSGDSYSLEPSSNQTTVKISNKDASGTKRSRAKFEYMTANDQNDVFCIKMSQKGVVSIFWDSKGSNDPVTILSKVLADVEGGSSASSRWCQRMVPMQGVCVYSTESCSSLVTKLVARHLEKSLPTELQPLRYAVSFNKRGFEPREIVNSKDSPNKEKLDRMSCIHVVTAAVANVTPYTVVDLNAPQMVVTVDIIPFAGLHSSPMCGVAVLSGALVNAKPRMLVKPLIPAIRQADKKGK